jgi:hypothetical protein
VEFTLLQEQSHWEQLIFCIMALIAEQNPVSKALMVVDLQEYQY